MGDVSICGVNRRRCLSLVVVVVVVLECFIAPMAHPKVVNNKFLFRLPFALFSLQILIGDWTLVASLFNPQPQPALIVITFIIIIVLNGLWTMGDGGLWKVVTLWLSIAAEGRNSNRLDF